MLQVLLSIVCIMLIFQEWAQEEGEDKEDDDQACKTDSEDSNDSDSGEDGNKVAVRPRRTFLLHARKSKKDCKEEQASASA